MVWSLSSTSERRAFPAYAGQDADFTPVYWTLLAKSVSQSHVLPPPFRTQQGVKDILVRLTAKALKRLREFDQLASAVQVFVDFRHTRDFSGYTWSKRSGKHLHSNEDGTWLKVIRPMLDALPLARFNCEPIRAGIVFTKLLLRKDVNLSLFDESRNRTLLSGDTLSTMIDTLNAKFDAAVEPAGSYWLREQSPYRITFGAPS